jgi:hypothetical protein
MEKRDKNRKFFHYNFFVKNRSGQYRRNNAGTIWFFVHLIVGLYFINLGFNFVNLGFADPVKNYITIAGGVLIIVAGFMSMRRTTPTVPYR